MAKDVTKLRVEVTQNVVYEIEVEAESPAEARRIVQFKIDNGEELDLYEKDNEGFKISSQADVHWAPESHWDEHPQFLVADWRTEVENDDTRQSYIDWVNSKIEAEAD